MASSFMKISENSTLKVDAKTLPERLLFLDFIRAVSVLMIILYHFDLQLQAQAITAHLIPGLVVFHQAIGDLGVTLFIMISGVGLMTSTSSSFSATEFYKKRFLGIFPSLWVAYLAVGGLLFLFRGFWVGDDQHWKFLLTITGFDGLMLYKSANYYLIGEWFIGFIILLYALFPMLRKGVLERPHVTWTIALIIAFTLHQYYGRFFNLSENRNPLIRLPEFIFGLCFIRYVLPSRKVAFVLSAFALAVFALWLPPIPMQFYGILLGMATFCTLAFTIEMVRFPQSIIKFVIWTAKYSFLAFLVHHQIIYVILPKFNVGQLTTIEVYVLFSIVIFLSFATAVLLHRPVERVTNALHAFLFARDDDPLLKTSGSILSFWVGAIGLIIFASTIYGVVRFYSPIPWWDEWDGYIGFYRNITTGWSGGWWVNHMEHRIVTSRILYWLDIKAFGGQHVFLLIVEQVMQASLVLVTWRAYVRGRNSIAPFAWIVGLPLAFLFSWVQYETFKWGFETQVIAAYMFSLFAAAAFTRSEGTRAGNIIWALIFATFAELSMANGLLAFPMLLGLCIICRRPAKDHAAILVAWIVMWGVYFFDYTKPPSTVPVLTTSETAIRFVKFFFVFLGNPASELTGSLLLCMVLGAATFLIAAWLTLTAYRTRSITPYRAFLIGVYGFVVLSALAAMSGRAYFGPAAATVSRYTTGPLLAWTMLALLAFDFSKTNARRHLTILISAISATVLATFQFHVKDDNSHLYNWKLAVLAHKIGQARPELDALLFPAEARSHFSDLATYAEKNHVALYGNGWLKDAGEVSFEQGKRDDSVCRGVIDSVSRDATGPVARGWLTTDTRQPDVLIVLTDTTGKTVGYGLTGAARPDVSAAVPGASANAGWTGFVLQTASPLNAYGYVSGRFCALK